jgi:hypothetical protein
MKIRTLAITVALLAILSIVAFIKNRPQAALSTDPRIGRALLDADTVSRAAGLEIADQGKTVELTREPDGSWRVASYYDLPADFDKIARLVQDLNEAKVDRFVTASPERLSHLEFKDSRIVLRDAAGKEIWKVTLGKTAESGNGRFIRFGGEAQAYFSGMHVWLDTDAKGWANAQLVSVKPDEVARIEVPFDSGPPVTLSRAKKDAPWTATGTPAGQKLIAEKASSILTTLTSLRFSETTDPKDASAAEAAGHLRVFRLTTFGGTSLTVALGRRPEEKRLKPPVADSKETPAALAKAADAKAEAKPITPEVETIPAGPVFVVISSSDGRAQINDLMKRRAFEVDDYTFTALPQKAGDLFEPEKAK